jgi:hypothetical protein
MEFVGRGRGFTDADPTGSVALDPTRRQMRDAVRRAVALILRAEDDLTEAGSVIANGYLRLDRAEWIRVVEKRSAALGRQVRSAEVRDRQRRGARGHRGRRPGRTPHAAGRRGRRLTKGTIQRFPSSVFPSKMSVDWETAIFLVYLQRVRVVRPTYRAARGRSTLRSTR